MTLHDQPQPPATTPSPEKRPSKIAKYTEEQLDDKNQEPQPEQENQENQENQTTMVVQNPNNIQRYLIAVEYIGTRFSGAQQQLPHCRTVVGVLQSAFQKFVGQPVSIFCSSRTDSGVHALSNVCHVDVERISKRKLDDVLPPYEPAVVQKAVNHFLQKNEGDIMITDVRCVAADFHSRYKAQERTYFYRLLSGPEQVSLFEKDKAWHVPEELNLLAMQQACKVSSSPYFPSERKRETEYLAGRGPSESNVDLSTSNQDKAFGEASLAFGMMKRHRCFVVTARARSFLYHQVRFIVGALKSVGTGDLTVSDVERILEAKAVTANAPMVPACGLYLGHVKYDLP